eukprot:3691975-Alexandrium_andersonii.AAC.1
MHSLLRALPRGLAHATAGRPRSGKRTVRRSPVRDVVGATELRNAWRDGVGARSRSNERLVLRRSRVRSL